MPQRPYNPNEWEDVTPPTPVVAKPINPDEWEDVTPPVPLSKNIVGQGWDMLNTAPKFITDRTRVDPTKTIIEGKPWGGWLEVPGALKDIAVNMFSGNRDVTESMKKGWNQGTQEGLGELMSPVNIADAVTGGGKSAVMRGLNYGVSGLTALGGINDVYEGNTGQGLAEIAGGALGLVAGPRGVNPKLAKRVITDADIAALDVPLKTETPLSAYEQPMADNAFTKISDPNLNAGIGDAELAGSVPYPHLSPSGARSFTPAEAVRETALLEHNNAKVLAAKTQPAKDAVIGQVDEVDEIIASLNNKPGTVESVDPYEGRVNNGSGAPGGGSAEEVLRAEAMRRSGLSFAIYDATGQKRIHNSPDYKAGPGESFGIDGPEGFQLLDGVPRPPKIPDTSVQPVQSSPVQASPTLYHGTTTPGITNFEPQGGSGFGNFQKWAHFAEDPEGASLYSLGEGRGMKREPRTGSPNTIPANVDAKNVLDLTKPLTLPEAARLFNEIRKIDPKFNLMPSHNSSKALDLAKQYYDQLPYDAIKHTEHGQTNWAVNPTTKMDTPWGVSLNKPTPKADLPTVIREGDAITQASKTNQFLDRDLRGAKPRFNIGTTSYEPHFTSDLDKAMFIIAQKTPSRRDADFLAYVMKETGLDEAGARAAGQKVREQIKTLVTGEKGGFIVIPNLTKTLPSKAAFNEDFLLETNPKAAIDNVKTVKGRLKAAEERYAKNPTEAGKAKVEAARRLHENVKAHADKLDLNKISPNTAAPNRPVVVADGPNSILVKRMDPETLEAALEQGYKLDEVNPIRDDGAIRLTKQGSPAPGPIIDSPKFANIAKSVASGQVPPIPPIPPKGPTSGAGGTGKGGMLPESKAAKTARIASDVWNFGRTVISSLDFSAPLRQGFPLIHKKAFYTSLDDMFRAWGSEKAYQAIQQSILDKPMFKPRIGPKGAPRPSFAEEAGLVLTDLDSLNTREESIVSKFAEMIPGVRRSNRAYTAYINKVRADTFEALINDAGVFAGGKVDLPLAKDLGKFVSIATGRGPLYALEPLAVQLNHGIFSPRLMSSRLHMLNPAYFIMSTPQVRKEHLKSLFAMAAVGSAVTQVGRMAGGTVEVDPASSDFGKLKIGNARLDPYGGFQQYIVAANRLINPSFLGGQRVKSSGQSNKEYDLWNPKPGPFDPNWMDIAARFARGKAHPMVGFAVSLAMNKTEMTGQKMKFGVDPSNLYRSTMDNAVAQRFVPLLLQDMDELIREDPKLGILLGIPTAFGMSSQVNENKRN